jgi:hypothetical protein
MTFSEFGRQIASNASLGTDHGDAAPMFLFGSCINSGIIGPNPIIPNAIDNQAGLPMQIDFRDVYASILKDWFEVDPMDIQPLFEQTINYIDVLGACNLGIAENEKEDDGILIYPNPATSNTTLKIETQNERVKIEIYDLNGRSTLLVCDKQLNQGTHQISCETIDLKAGEYIVKVFKSSGILSTKLSKIK